jgi:hypothetical protein
MQRKFGTVAILAILTLAVGSLSADQPGESGALGERLDQDALVEMSLTQAIREGERIFTTPFNHLDGYGDGPLDPVDTISPGGRPTLQGNGMFLRINGLDAQACLECHTLVSNATVPATLGIGGAGGSNANAIIQPSDIDPADLDLDGVASFSGRFANPPALFGVGGVELVGLEMTAELQALKQLAIDNPFSPVDLVAKGVEFGTITADGLGNVDTSLVEGVDDDLVVRPFGRKGEFATTRDFDLAAMMFHFGIQPVEEVGAGVDGDGDGMLDEVSVGEISALGVFLSTRPRPVQGPMSGEAQQGQVLFTNALGCADCHIPSLFTNTKELPLRFPQVATDPWANVYTEIDISKPPAGFTKAGAGVVVPMFADLKRHDMGPGLAEDFSLASDEANREFTTAKLWGVADSGPWLHDGRAQTLTDAIMMHGGEAQDARDNFAALSDDQKASLLEFLRSLQNPRETSARGNPTRIRGAQQSSAPGPRDVSLR